MADRDASPRSHRPPAVARNIWRRLEPIHAISYFAPESAAAFDAAGYKGFWMGYFAGRAAPLGPVGPEVVEALFYNFTAARVARALPEAWALAPPAVALDARRTGASAALRRALGDGASAPGLVEAAALLARVASAAPREGRPLYAANSALPWPDEPIDALWHGATLLREHRGDGHVGVLITARLGGRECNVFQAAAGNVPRTMIERARDYDESEWSAVTARLAGRGLVTIDGELTREGRALKQDIEERTDSVALAAYDDLADGEVDRLVELLDPIARAVVMTGEIPAATPMGPTLR
ncbi:MAG: hypothetical protein ABW328_18955 [Ilumatobacteraceae bacterium]